MMAKYGPVYRSVNLLKPWDVTVMVGDPQLLKEIFVGKDWTLFERGHPIGKPHFPYTEGIISDTNGQRWRDTRALFERTFSTVSVRKCVAAGGNGYISFQHLTSIFHRFR